MKRLQRNFLVEYKSSRRSTKPPANSIWGDSDLKAVARELEDQLHPAFINEPTQAIPPNEMVLERKSVEVASLNEATQQTSVIEARTAPTPSASDLLPEPEPAAPLSPEKTSVEHKRKPRGRKPKQAALVVTEYDELEQLQSENDRLKMLLADRLRAENAQLRQMLGRLQP